VRASARYRVGVTGRDGARELLGFFAEGFERRTNGKRLRNDHGDLLSFRACTPLTPG
jgi:hypothetical protein